MSNVVAISTILLTCLGSEPLKNNDGCTDGKPKVALTVNWLSATVQDTSCVNWGEWLIAIKDNWRLPTCVNQWDSVIEISRDGRTLFILKPTGDTQVSDNFSPDEGAKVFFKSFIDLFQRIEK